MNPNNVQTCNTTLYTVWKNQEYTGLLATDPNFWIYQTQRQFVLTNELALNLAVEACRGKFDDLDLFLAGRSGPITIQKGYTVMCSNECLQSDIMHQDAMAYTGCSCLELSTQPKDLAYTIEGDWCRHNSALILCDKLEFCGIWGCRLDDFMCPRYEWNKKYIELQGIGTCAVNAASKVRTNPSMLMSIVIMILLIFFMRQ